MMRPLFCALALFTMLTPALPQEAATAPAVATPPASPPSVKLDSGVTITPVARPATDLEAIMDVHFWRFHIESPVVADFSQRLELRVPGKKPQFIGIAGVTLSGVKSLDLLVGLAPIDSAYLNYADNWKTYYRMQGTAQTSKPFDLPFTGPTQNPIKGLKFGSIRYGTSGTTRDYSLPQANGDVALITLTAPKDDPLSFKTDPDAPIIAEVFLVLTAKPAATN